MNTQQSCRMCKECYLSGFPGHLGIMVDTCKDYYDSQKSVSYNPMKNNQEKKVPKTIDLHEFLPATAKELMLFSAVNDLIRFVTPDTTREGKKEPVDTGEQGSCAICLKRVCACPERNWDKSWTPSTTKGCCELCFNKGLKCCFNETCKCHQKENRYTTGIQQVKTIPVSKSFSALFDEIYNTWKKEPGTTHFSDIEMLNERYKSFFLNYMEEIYKKIKVLPIYVAGSEVKGTAEKSRDGILRDDVLSIIRTKME